MNLTAFAANKFLHKAFSVEDEGRRITSESDCPGCFPDAFYTRYPKAEKASICLCVFIPKGTILGRSAEAAKSMMQAEGHTCVSDAEHWKPEKEVTCKMCKKWKAKQTLPAYKPMPPGTKFS